ncbi:META domain-containing protein [Hyphococcus sp.]|uniref:META domain-containing protein n=1 Tax=Hyphococcus sp. TaxID=2038636 RepID=UPI003CCBBFFD
MRLALLAFFALASCSAEKEPAEPAPADVPLEMRADAPPPVPVWPDDTVPFRFRSEDGSWGGAVIGRLIYLDSPTSAGWYSSAVVTKEIPPGGTILRTGAITLTIEDGGCNIGPLRENHPDRVFVDWDGGRFAGCGGRMEGPEEIAGTHWSLMELGGVEAAGRPPAATLTFSADGRTGGTIACNDGGLDLSWTAEGGFSQDGGEFAQTAMECADPEGEAFARRFWMKMESAARWRRNGGDLVIKFADGETARLEFLR